MACNLFLVLVVAGCALNGQACPSGFFTHEESCYVVPAMLASWAEAKVYCQAVGADLAIIDSKEEQSVLDNYLSIHSHAYRGHTFWLDAADYVEEGSWMWVSSRLPLSATFWAKGQPDNHAGSEHCLTHDQSNHGWNDDHCQELHSFVCEMENESFRPVQSASPIIG